MSKGSTPVGVSAVILGGYLIDCAVKNRGPISTLKAIIADPAHAEQTVHDAPIWKQPNNPYEPPAGGGHAPGDPGDPPSGVIGKVLAYEAAQIGKPYCWGGIGPNCYDCSGLAYMAYKSVGISVPRTTAGMLASTKLQKVQSLAACKPGDLIFPYPGHVFTYTGGGMMIEAPHTGSYIHRAKVYKFWTARRVVA